MVISLEALADFVGIDALFKVKAGKIFSKDVLNVRVRFLESSSRRGILSSVEPLVHVGTVVAIVVLAVHSVLLSRNLVTAEGQH